MKKEPTFEEEEDEEFLPAASAKSGAYKPYNDTWRGLRGPRPESSIPRRCGDERTV